MGRLCRRSRGVHGRRFRARGADCVFELAPNVSAELLLARGYEAAGREDVVVRYPPFTAPEPAHRVTTASADEWPELMRACYGAPDVPLWRSITEAGGRLPGSSRLGVKDDAGMWIACAQLMPAGEVAIFGNDVPSNRRVGAECKRR